MSQKILACAGLSSRPLTRYESTVQRYNKFRWQYLPALCKKFQRYLTSGEWKREVRHHELLKMFQAPNTERGAMDVGELKIEPLDVVMSNITFDETKIRRYG